MELKRCMKQYSHMYLDIQNDNENIYVSPDNTARTSGNAAIPKNSDYKKRFPDLKRLRRRLSASDCLRGLNNALPITIRKRGGDYFTDKDFNEFKKYIDDDFEHIKRACIERKPKRIYFPYQGLFGDISFAIF